jgi:hypothetical protein
MILNAMYLPGGGESILNPAVSPEDTFPLIFDYYFKDNFPMPVLEGNNG